MLRRKVSSPSLKVTAGTTNSAPNSPGLPHGLSPLSLHYQGSALASLQPSSRFLDFYLAAPRSPTITKSRLDTQNYYFSPPVHVEPSPPEQFRLTKGEATRSAKYSAQPVRFELPPVVIKGLPVQRGLPGFASFNFGNVHSVTYRSTCERLPTPYPPREDLDWLELQDEAEFYALGEQEDPDSDSDSSTPGTSTKSPPSSLLISGFPSALCLSEGDAIPSLKKSPPLRLRQRSLPHSKSLGALETPATNFITATTSSLSSSRPSARPMLLSALSSALARRERSRRIGFEALPFAIHINVEPSQRSSKSYIPTPFPSPRVGRVLDPNLMFDSAS